MIYLLLLFYSVLLVIRWRSSVKPGSQQEIKAIYLTTLCMMSAVLIGAICNNNNNNNYYYYYYYYIGLLAVVASASECAQSMLYVTLY
jgi:hypothetical protein